MAQTAESAMQAVTNTDNLQRMRELAVQAANGTYTGRPGQPQHRIPAAAVGNPRVVGGTTFNGQNVLNLTSAVIFQVGAGTATETPSQSRAAVSCPAVRRRIRRRDERWRRHRSDRKHRHPDQQPEHRPCHLGLSRTASVPVVQTLSVASRKRASVPRPDHGCRLREAKPPT